MFANSDSKSSSDKKMEVIYYETRQSFMDIQTDFQRYERSSYDTTIEEEIQQKLQTAKNNCENLDTFTHKIALDKRVAAKVRTDHLKYDIRHMEAAFKALKGKKHKHHLELMEREQLLNKRFDANSDTTINIDYSLQQNTSMQNAHRGVDEMIFTGSSVLESLRAQRGTLKGAHRRIVDMANTLGLSNHTMRLIEKRVSQDKFLLFGGMFFTLVIIILVIIYIA